MNIKSALLVPAFTMLLPFAAHGAGHEDAEACNTMLGTAIGLQLESEGFDMTNACALTVAEVAQIKNLLETEGMGSRPQIQLILSEAE